MTRPLAFSLILLANSLIFAIDLDQVMSAPFSSELVAGPGGRVAWVVNTRGTRNVWVAEAPEFKGRALTKFTGDDGVDIGGLEWTHDGKGVVFVRGGDLEHPGSANPNPSNSAASQEQWVEIASLADGSVKKLGEGHTPTVAGDRVAYIKGGQVWSAPLTGDAKPAVLVTAKGAATEVKSSPNGAKLAIVSSRADHAFIGIYTLATKELKYIDPSLDTDMSVVWSPDSNSVAFIRIPAAIAGVRFGPQRTAKQPWTIRVADIATGTSRLIFEAVAGPGSRFAIDSGGTPLLWADGRLVFPWERDGWLHLYSVPVAGGRGDALLLTPGDFEVEYMSLSPDRKTVVFASNQDDVDRRHIWRVAASGGRAQRLTTGTGLEWAPVEVEGGLVCLRSDTKIPSRAAILSTNGTLRDLAPELVPAGYPVNALVDPQPVMLPAADGMLIHGQLFMPPAGGPDKKPALIFFHGGSRRQMLLGRHGMYYYSNAYGMNQYLASLGYIVLSVNYRSGIGYGLNFREALNYGVAGASEYNDVIGAGLYLRNRSDVDASRIGLWGGSYGGYLTALGLAHGSDLFKCGVDFHGVHDWTKLRRGIENDPEAARIAFQSSPMSSIDTWRSPVLLIHGDDDRNVPFSESIRLVEALRDRKVHVEQLIFPDEIHDFLGHDHWYKAYQATADFFRRML